MKKLLVVLLFILSACQDKEVSQEYYRKHLDEAKAQILQCEKNKDENSLNCKNATMAIQADSAKKYQDKVANSLR